MYLIIISWEVYIRTMLDIRIICCSYYNYTGRDILYGFTWTVRFHFVK